MYATLPSWIVESGDLPAPTAGSVLVRTGLRARCLTVATSREEPGTVRPLLDRGQGAPPHLCELHGIASAGRDYFVDIGQGLDRRAGAEFALDLVRFQVVGSTDLPEDAIKQGAKLTVTCSLTVIAEYEWASFDLPDVRRDWLVVGVDGDTQPDFVLDLQPK